MPNLDSVIFKFKMFTNQCAKNDALTEVKDAVQLANERIDDVLYAGKIFQGESKVITKLVDANDGLKKIGEALSKVKNFCVDVNTLFQIRDAVAILSDDKVIYNDKIKAAAAFDMLFQGFGRFIRLLPPPANQWQQFFESFTLFSSMAPKLDPNIRWAEWWAQIDGMNANL